MNVPRRSPAQEQSTSHFMHAAMWAAAVFMLFVLLGFPGRIDQFNGWHFLRWPIELPALILALTLVPRKLGSGFRLVLVVAVCLLLLLRIGDIGSRLAFGRAFSPLAELHLVAQGWTLASDTVGRTEAVSGVAMAAVLLVLIAVILYRWLGRIDQFTLSARRQIGWASAGLLALSGAALLVHTRGGPDLGVRADVGREFVERVQAARRSVEDQAEFSALMAVDPVPSGARAPRFTALAGLDVIVLFVESYGRSYVDAERFTDAAHQTYARVDSVLQEAGLAVRSAWLDSPIRGGRSWLAQATFSSGLPLKNQARFDRLLSSERPSIHRLFSDAGWQSNVVLPVVKDTWVEGAWYDVDRFFDRAAMEFAGRSLGYVPMPDQYTLSAFEEKVRASADGPMMASIGLLDSHAPWTPLPLPVPWDAVGDGAIFDGSNRYGEPMDWADPGPVREMYGKSVTGALARIGEYLALYARDALVIVVGDHQPASIIASWAPNAHVPIHVVSANPALLDRLPAAHFGHGMLPRSEAEAIPMQDFRTLLSTVYEEPLAPEVTLTVQPPG